MAQKVVVSLVDDLDESDADETVEFGLDGVTYEIDLTDAHATSLRDTLASYVAAARRTGGRRRTASARPASGGSATRPAAARGSAPARVDREQNQAIRECARREGWTVSARGRIPAEVANAYQQANG